MVTKRKIIDILTDIVGVCGFIGSISGLALGIIPVQYAAQAVAVFAAIAVGGSAFKKLIDVLQGTEFDVFMENDNATKNAQAVQDAVKLINEPSDEEI